MNRILLLSVALAGTQLLTAEEINSNVIHNYRYVGVAYDYVHSDQSQFPDGHGGSGFASYDFKNFLFGGGGGYMQGSDNNLEVKSWTVHGDVGYVLRLCDNHLNIIPSFGIGYGETTETFHAPFFPFIFEFDSESTAISPGLSVSYAFNNYFSANIGYSYGYDLDTYNDAHSFSVGAECALTKEVGLGVGVHFDSEAGFTGLSTGISFHF